MADADIAIGAAGAPRRSQFRLPRLGVLIAGGIIVGMIVLAVLAPVLPLHDPYLQNLLERTVPPVWMGGTWEHPLGTDTLGRDYLSRLIYGARIALAISFGAAAMSCVIGSVLGGLAGYFGGRVDTIISFIITARLSIPIILVALAVVASLGTSFEVVICVLGLLLWDRFALVVRATTRQLRSKDFITAAILQGCSTTRILLVEVLPNILPQIIIVFTLEVAQAIILESALSFLGLGIPPPMPSWALMIAEGKAQILFNWWLIAIPGLALFALVISMNICGDSLRAAVLREESDNGGA